MIHVSTAVMLLFFLLTACSLRTREATPTRLGFEITPTPAFEDLQLRAAGKDAIHDFNWIALSWDSLPVTITAFVLERAEDEGGPFETVAILRPEALSLISEDGKSGSGSSRFEYIDKGLAPGRRYYYRMYACGVEGRTRFAGSASAIAPDTMPGTEPTVVPTESLSPPC